jgi:HAD superfamily hydrolase (TIGR01549 family)
MPAVTLDLWHTLIYLEPEAEEAYMEAQVAIAQRVLAESPPLPGVPPLADGELARAFEIVYAEAVRQSSLGRTMTPAQQIAEAGRVTGRRPQAERYIEGLAAEVGSLPFEAAPGALEFLGHLRDDGYRVGIISNTVGEPGRFLRPVLSSMGFDPYVQSYVFSDEHPWTKPAPEIFHAALAELGERPEQSVHVGDGWSDVEGARRAGYRAGILFTGLNHYGARYKALFLPPSWDRPPTPHVAERLDQVLGQIRDLLPRSTPP